MGKDRNFMAFVYGWLACLIGLFLNWFVGFGETSFLDILASLTALLMIVIANEFIKDAKTRRENNGLG